MRITGDTLEPSLGSNITVPNGMGISVSSTEVLEIGTTGIIAQQPYWNIVDQKANGTNGGTFTSGAWQTRDLNTTIGSNTITGSSLSSNRFTLPSGTYRIFASATGGAVGLHKAILYNITDSSTTLIGTSELNTTANTNLTRSFISGIFNIVSQKTFEIRHQCGVTGIYGTACNFGVPEIYTQVELWKLGN